MKPPLWDHQAAALKASAGRPATLLHMGLGTGKTRVACELLEQWRVGRQQWRISRVIVICPLSVVPTWSEEMAKYAERDWLLCPMHKMSTAKKRKLVEQVILESRTSGRPIMLTINFESVWREPLASYLRKAGFEAVIVDEAHRIKSPRGVASKYLAKLGRTADFRLALTGTPMPSGPLDVFGLMRYLSPDVFGQSFVRFRNRYAKLGGFGGKEVVGFRNLEELTAKMSPLTFQVGREVLDLPSATHNIRHVELGKEALKAYNAVKAGIVAELEDGEITASNALVQLLRMQQLTSGYAALDEQDTKQIDTAKRDELLELFNSMEPGEPVVVFGQFRGDMQTVHEAAEAAGRSSLELSGKRREMQEWKDGGADVLAVQIASGGAGVDLTRARYCVYLSTGFNLGNYVQSLARCHRPGQTKPVSYYHILARGSIDETVHHALRHKQNVVDAILATLTP